MTRPARMARLSAAQRRVLEAMALKPEQRLVLSVYKVSRYRYAGQWKVRAAVGTIPRAWAAANTARALIRAGLVEIAGEGENVYRLTPFGRAAPCGPTSPRGETR